MDEKQCTIMFLKPLRTRLKKTKIENLSVCLPCTGAGEIWFILCSWVGTFILFEVEQKGGGGPSGHASAQWPNIDRCIIVSFWVYVNSLFKVVPQTFPHSFTVALIIQWFSTDDIASKWTKVTKAKVLEKWSNHTEVWKWGKEDWSSKLCFFFLWLCLGVIICIQIKTNAIIWLSKSYFHIAK